MVARVRVHLVDGTYELFRGFFGAPSYQHAGKEIAATRVVVTGLARLLRTGVITHGGVAFDHVIESFRNGLFPGYKTGEGVPAVLFEQFPLVERAVAALGLVVWPMVDFEADDAIATAAARCAADPRVDEIRITAVDKDMCQCVRGARVVVWDRFKDAILDEPGVIAKHGVAPAAIADYLALVGDTADGIPGIPGFGKATAAKVLGAYGRLEDIPGDAAAWTVTVRGADRLAQTLRERRDDALLYKRLATLREDATIDGAPIACDPDALAWKGVDREALAAIGAELNLDPASLKL